jgi:drug/metabolite transporter (DMT)-like permease
VSALSYAVAMVVQKSVLRRLPALQVTWLACVIGTLGCVGFLPSLIRDLEAAPVQSSLGVLYLGLVPTALAFTTWAYALSRVSAGQLGVTTYLVPPITIGLAWLLLGEVPSLLAVAGGVLSLVGVAVTRTRGRRPADAAPVVEVSAGR